MPPKIAVPTFSLGWHPSFSLERKVRAASDAGFDGIELFMEDLQPFATRLGVTRVEAAERFRKLLDEHQLGIVCVGSMENWEGNTIKSLEDRLNEAREWIDIAHAVGTDLVQISCTEISESTGDESVIVSEFRELADLGIQYDSNRPIRFAYEALGWGTHIADWEDSLRIVDAVSRPNFGLCLDTYHVLGRIWADPSLPSGRRPGGDYSLRSSLERFTSLGSGIKDKIFYIQLSDAEKMNPPILPGHPAFSKDKSGVHAWCLYGRIFPYQFELGAYLPMDDILKVWLVSSGVWTDSNIWISLEIFHRDMDTTDRTPEWWAQAGIKSWNEVRKVVEQ